MVGLLISLVLTIVFSAIPVLLVVAFVNYLQEKKKRSQVLEQSQDYQNAVAQARQFAAEKQAAASQETAAKQAEIDAKYKSDLEYYNTVTIPQYNKDFAQWKSIQEKKIAMLEEDLFINNDTLTNLYDTTRQISLTYRELWILRWLYDDMRTSDHDIRYATELLDRDRQRLATEQSGRMVREAIGDLQSSMNEGFLAVYAAVEEGNEELAKTRRDQNRANTIGIIQRYKLNKSIKLQNEMLDEHFNGKK